MIGIFCFNFCIERRLENYSNVCIVSVSFIRLIVFFLGERR